MLRKRLAGARRDDDDEVIVIRQERRRRLTIDSEFVLNSGTREGSVSEWRLASTRGVCATARSTCW
jgi:hypothetical protein